MGFGNNCALIMVEFVLTTFVQELIESYCYSRNKTPLKQTVSTDNYVVERFWPEVNSRVNYPIKKILLKIVDEYDCDLNDPIIKHSLSFISCNLARDPFNILFNFGITIAYLDLMIPILFRIW